MPADERPEVFYRAGGPVSRGGWTRINVRRWLIIAIVLAALAAASALYLEQTSRVATCSNDIRLLEERKQRLRLEIAGLNADIAQASSLERVQAYASEHNYLDTRASDSTVVVLTIDSTLSSVESEGESQVVVGSLPETADSGFFFRLLEYLGWTADAGMNSSNE